jgi:protein-disulfide isomerase
VAGVVVGVSLDQLALRTILRPATPPSKGGALPSAPLAPPPEVAGEPIYRVPLEDSPQRGPRSALVTIVESSDFECPFCKKVAPTLRQIESAYGDQVRFVFKHNPLPMHPSALPAAKLAEEARAQGGDARFWAMHDRLFALPALDRAALEKAGQDVGLSAAAIREALDGPKYLDRIQRDQKLVLSLGATGTPSFFLKRTQVRWCPTLRGVR